MKYFKKAKAFLDLKKRKEAGETIDSRNIKKHKNDVIRLAVMLTEEKTIKLPDAIFADIEEYIESIENDPPDFAMLGKSAGIPTLDGKRIVEQIKKTFSI